jgi:hypothetical protein
MREANGPAESKDPYRHEHRRTEQGVLSMLDQVEESAPAILSFCMAQRFTAAIQTPDFEGLTGCGKTPV